MDLRRWTPFTFLIPSRYVSRGPFWTEFDLESWSESDYTWTEDSWNGFRDFAEYPRATVAAERGDCEDYALVALSWGIANDRDGVGIAFCWQPPYPWPTHVIAFDDERVYSSGYITTESPAEWLDRSDYTFYLTRRVR